jgi:hypothetical protein
MKKMLASLAFAFVAFMPTLSSAQQVDAAYTFGKVYDIPEAEFTAFHIPEVELRTKGITFNARWGFDAFTGNVDFQELATKYSFKIEAWSKKLVYTTSLSHVNYFVPFVNPAHERRGDWTYSLTARYPLKR